MSTKTNSYMLHENPVNSMNFMHKLKQVVEDKLNSLGMYMEGTDLN